MSAGHDWEALAPRTFLYAHLLSKYVPSARILPSIYPGGRSPAPCQLCSRKEKNPLGKRDSKVGSLSNSLFLQLTVPGELPAANLGLDQLWAPYFAVADSQRVLGASSGSWHGFRVQWHSAGLDSAKHSGGYESAGPGNCLSRCQVNRHLWNLAACSLQTTHVLSINALWILDARVTICYGSHLQPRSGAQKHSFHWMALVTSQYLPCSSLRSPANPHCGHNRYSFSLTVVDSLPVPQRCSTCDHQQGMSTESLNILFLLCLFLFHHIKMLFSSLWSDIKCFSKLNKWFNLVINAQFTTEYFMRILKNPFFCLLSFITIWT